MACGCHRILFVRIIHHLYSNHLRGGFRALKSNSPAISLNCISIILELYHSRYPNISPYWQTSQDSISVIFFRLTHFLWGGGQNTGLCLEKKHHQSQYLQECALAQEGVEVIRPLKKASSISVSYQCLSVYQTALLLSDAPDRWGNRNPMDAVAEGNSIVAVMTTAQPLWTISRMKLFLFSSQWIEGCTILLQWVIGEHHQANIKQPTFFFVEHARTLCVIPLVFIFASPCPGRLSWVLGWLPTLVILEATNCQNYILI